MAFINPKMPILLGMLVWLILLPKARASSFEPIQTTENLSASDQSKPVSNDISGQIKFGDILISDATIYAFDDQWVGKSVSDHQGKFQIKRDFSAPAKILTMANGKRSQLLSLETDSTSELQVQLEDQPAPLKGRIIDHQGMGVENARLRIVSLRQGEKTIPIPDQLKSDRIESTTDKNGTFQIDGMSRSLVGTINVSGQGFVTSTITSETFADSIVLVVEPARSIKGKVIDRISKTPIKDVAITASAGGQQVQCTESGEFELSGLAAFQPSRLTAKPIGDKAYVMKSTTIPIENGFASINLEIELEPGVWVKSKVRNFGTNGPASAQIYYFPTPENENFQTYVDAFQGRGAIPSSSTDANGSVSVVAIPGPGVIAVYAQGFPPNETANQLTEEQIAMLAGISGRNDLTALAWIDPKNLNDHLDLNFLVSQGRAIAIELEGKTEATDQLVVHRAASKTSFSQTVKGAKFLAEQFQPGESRQILVHAIQKKLGAVLELDAESESPVRLKLQPTGGMIGRVTDEGGEPQSGLSLLFELPTDNGFQEIATQVFTDANGRFEKFSLISGLNYRVSALRLSKNQQMMMSSSPKVDSRWIVAEELAINSSETVDLGVLVLGATQQPAPQRSIQKDVESSDDSLPAFINGIITDDNGEPVVNASITFNTWPNRSGKTAEDLKLAPIVLAQSKSDSNGNFRLAIDRSLQEKLIYSKSDGEKANAAVVVVSENHGATQLHLQDIPDSKSVKIQLNREMVVRGNVSIAANSEAQKVNLTLGSHITVYDVDSINEIVTLFQNGTSLKKATQQFQPIAALDSVAGGVPLIWKTNKNGVFLVRNIPLNAIFELHAIGESGDLETFTVISRPIRGFDIKLTDDAKTTHTLHGSRIRLKIGQPAVERSGLK